MQDWLTIISFRCRPDDCAFKDVKTGKRARTFKPLTPKLLAFHLDPTHPVFYGGYLMVPGESTTRLAVLDVDDHSGELGWSEVLARGQALAFELQEEGYSPALFRSSGGKGLHVWLYWDAPQDAYSVRQVLAEAVKSAGYEVKAGAVEVFPKQDQVEPDGCGNPVFFPVERLDKRDWKASPAVPVLQRPEPVAASHAAGSGGLVKLADALKALPNDAEEPADYDTWLKVGMAVHHASGGSDDGLALWNDWSRTNPNYDETTQVAKWGSFGSKTGGVTEATIYRLALDKGWQWSSPDGIRKLMEAGKKLAGKNGGEDEIRKMIQGDFPAARHLTTDQANGERLFNRAKDEAAGYEMVFAAGQWYFWTGKYWAADEAAAYRATCQLSTLIEQEAKEWEARQAPSEEEREKNLDIAKALRKWGKNSEMKPRLDAAFSILKRLVEIPAGTLDADPYALNVRNGTVDLRTGGLRPHCKSDFITKIIMVDYDQNAQAPIFERTLQEITGEDRLQTKPITHFLQRWFGYCATGAVQEQVFMVHYGVGANGKSLLLNTIADVLGVYAGAAAPQLMMEGASDRHPAELADLRGKRMVTTSESGENGVLREEFIKAITGGDRIKARFMRQDFFEFSPTHKLQLVTNYKPAIRGQDHGIWRRVLLVPYNVTFGSVSEVEQKNAHRVRNDALNSRIKTETEGILAWLINGAKIWHAKGLNPPDIIIAAGKDYRKELDRIGQFIEECCERDVTAWAPLSNTNGLFPTYQKWCGENGYHSLGRLKFQQTLERQPGITPKVKKFMGASGRPVVGNGYCGIRLINQFFTI